MFRVVKIGDVISSEPEKSPQTYIIGAHMIQFQLLVQYNQ